MRPWLLVLTLLMAVPALAQTTQTAGDFDRIDTKFKKATESGKWSDASLQLIAAFYADYRAAHAAGKWGAERRNIGRLGLIETESPADYVGTFGMPTNEGGKARPFATITREPDGRLFAQIEKHRIPAAPWNGAILITTGDIVYGPLPQLGAKPHASVELFILVKTKDGFALTDTSGQNNRPLVKIESGAAQ